MNPRIAERVRRRGLVGALAVLTIAPGGCAGAGEGGDPRPVQLFVVDREGGDSRRLTHDDRFHSAPVWSPDGRWIAALAGAPARSGLRGLPGLEVMRSDGAGRRVVRSQGVESLPAWSPDGRRLAFVERQSLVIASAATRPHGRDRVVGRTVGMGTASGPTWSRDGRWVAFASRHARACLPRYGCADAAASPFQTDISVADARTSRVRRLTRTATAMDGEPQWSPGGRRILFTRLEVPVAGVENPTNPGLWVVSLGGRTRRVLERMGSGSRTAWSPDGRHVAVVGDVRAGPTGAPSAREGLHVVDARTGAARTLVTDAFLHGGVAWSADGDLLAFVTADGIEVIDSHGEGRRTLVERGRGDGIMGQLAWSPDGSRLGFTVEG